MLANIALMMIFYYLNVKQNMFAQLDVPRFTTVAVVFTPVVAGIICYARHKKKDDTAGAVIAVALITLAAAFIGSVCGAAMAAAAFGIYKAGKRRSKKEPKAKKKDAGKRRDRK